MPYIKQELRDQLDPFINNVINAIASELDTQRAGMLNYTISQIVSECTSNVDEYSWSYNEIAETIATFECAKLEFYRRVAGPKEDRAIKENGDLQGYEFSSSRN